MRRYFRLQWLALRVGVMSELQYRVNFYVQIVQSVFSLVTGVAGLGLIFSHTTTLEGWRASELLAVLGVYLLLGGVINSVIRPNLQRLMDDVREGTLDFVLTKPEDAQLLISTRRVEIWRIADVVIGAAVIGVALWQLGAVVGTVQALVFAITLLAGALVIYSFLLLLATCSFWFIKIQNIMIIFDGVYEAGRWPVGIYPGWLRSVLTLLVPIAFAVTVPAEALAGRLNGYTLLGSLALTVTLLVGSRWFWLQGVRQYSGASA